MRIRAAQPAGCCALLALSSLLCMAQEFKQYPGSKLDEKASQESSRTGGQSQVYTTDDSFERIYVFYKTLYREYKWPMPAPELPSGKRVKWAFFILDNGQDLAHSKYFVKIQRPYVGTIGGSGSDFKDIRDISAIQTIRPAREHAVRLPE